MKVTVKEKSDTKEYPWIGISEDMIVLFTARDSGIRLTPIGFYSKGW